VGWETSARKTELNSMTNTLVVVPELSIERFFEDGKLKLPEEEVKRRDELAYEASCIKAINTAAERDQAINTAARLKGLEEEMSEAHVAAKKNFLVMCQAIDEAKRNFNNPMTAERERLNRLIGSFEQARREAAAKAQRELEAERTRALAEAYRLQREAEATKDLATAIDIEEQAEQSLVKAEQITRSLEVAEAPKPSGGAQRTEIDIVVTDINALYLTKPYLCVLKPDLVALKYEINHRLKEGETIPGVTFTKTATFATRKR
jgi:hypothetical protein